jgi:hypothetical protein
VKSVSETKPEEMNESQCNAFLGATIRAASEATRRLHFAASQQTFDSISERMH